MAAKRATVQVETIYIVCPNKRCGEAVPEPRHGSLLWSVDQLPGDELITCPYCRQQLTLPSRVALPNGLGA